MKYLKPFNESLSFEEELKDFCGSNLAYLIDDGMRLSFDEYNGDAIKLGVNLSFRAIGGIKWGDIRDYIIPFFVRLSKEYTIKEIFRSNAMYQVEMQISPEGTFINFVGNTCNIFSWVFHYFIIEYINQKTIYIIKPVQINVAKLKYFRLSIKLLTLQIPNEVRNAGKLNCGVRLLA